MIHAAVVQVPDRFGGGTGVPKAKGRCASGIEVRAPSLRELPDGLSRPVARRAKARTNSFVGDAEIRGGPVRPGRALRARPRRQEPLRTHLNSNRNLGNC